MGASIRTKLEKREKETLSPLASLSSETRGRRRWEQPCDLRTEFQRDRDRILHSKSFRRLKHKTQVFIAPESDHFRTRLTHTLEVAQIARTIAKALFLNEDLTEAIALGHDLGHTPFGHTGEETLNEIVPGGFKHNEQSLRVVDILEAGGGLNLTEEVRDGILCHTGKTTPFTLEGQIVKIADRIAYINHDIDDAIRGGILENKDLPKECISVLGQDHRTRINTMVSDLVETSAGQKIIRMSPPVWEATLDLRAFLFEKVYVGSAAKAEVPKAKRVIKELFRYYMDNPDLLPQYKSGNDLNNDGLCRAVCDYVAGMTDRYAIGMYQELFVPSSFHI